LESSKDNTHPSLDIRIKRSGKIKEYKDLNYDKKISFITSFNAKVEFCNNHFKQAISLCDKNILAGVESEDDLLIKAMALSRMSNTKETNLESFELIQKAKRINIVPPIDLYKQEGLILLRLDKNIEAIESLEKYNSEISNRIANLEKVKSSTLWQKMTEYLVAEREWTLKMISKIKRL
jgi:hypothetical protein